MKIRDRIRELRRVPASELRPNPKNWRTHPEAQANALRGLLAEVGIADAVLAREDEDGSLILLDGHLRVETMGGEILPVLVLDVDEDEGDKILATLDPLAAMAEADAEKLDAILREIDTDSADVKEMLSHLAEDNKLHEAGEVAPPELPDGDRTPFRQMTFTVHDEQHAVIEEAMAKAKKAGGDSSEVNENSNGNALAFICKAYVDE